MCLMHDAVVLAVKMLAGGSLVVVFALVSEVVGPRRFSGLFAAAPAIALASLTVTLFSDGVSKAHEAAVGMIVGSAGMICYCPLVSVLLVRVKALRASLIGLVAWFGVAGALYVGVLR
jgi:hypothetical protein